MATIQQFLATHPVERRSLRRLFFPAMSLFAIAIVLLAFIPEYVGHERRSFPGAWAVRIHAAIMTAWIALFFVQAYLGATRRIAQHRRLGNIGIVAGWLALLSMIFVQGRFLILNPLPEDISIYDRLLPFLYVYPTFSIFLFSAYRKRTQPDWHKRLITFALFVSLEAAVQRLEWLPSGFGYWPVAAFLDVSLLLPLVSYDIFRLKRLHPATIRGALLILVAQAILFSLWGTAVWRHFAYAAMHAIFR